MARRVILRLQLTHLAGAFDLFASRAAESKRGMHRPLSVCSYPRMCVCMCLPVWESVLTLSLGIRFVAVALCFLLT